MKSVNKVFLLGSVGRDPEIKSTASGMTIASFSLATNDARKNADGKWTDEVTWHSLVAFGRTAEIIRDYTKKGSPLLVQGKIQTRSWDDKQSGKKQYRTEIVVDELSLLGTSSAKATSVQNVHGVNITDNDLPANMQDDDDSIPF